MNDERTPVDLQVGLNLAKPKILANRDWGPGHLLQWYVHAFEAERGQ
jgi:hypothetical protein